jgi:hypothetical protein
MPCQRSMSQKREKEKNKDSPYFQKLQREIGMTMEYKNLEKNIFHMLA